MNKNSGSKKHLVRTNVQSIKERKNSQRSNSQNQNMKKNKSNISNINNMKQNVNKGGYYSKADEDLAENTRVDKEDNINGNINLSLRKFIFTKCGNPASNSIINKKY